MKYKKVKPGEWEQPVRRAYRLACCDCGLVHNMYFRLRRRNSRGARTIQFKAYRNERATAAMRRGKK